jgi:Escherichia/Staphylococcus phage prohead protease
MSAAELAILETEEIFAVRTYAVDLTAGDGRTVDLRIAPYGERIKANDGLGGLPRGVVYEEEILPGAFDHQLNAANRVLLNVEHEAGIAGVVGRGSSLASRSDGFYGSFRLLETPAGDTALELVKAGALAGASLEARFVKSIRTAAGVVQRAKAHLRNVALCRDPAYSGALVLGVRTEQVILDEENYPVPFDPELAERIEALGLEVPERLKARHPAYGHPVSNGTPAAAPLASELVNSTDTEE